MASKMDTLFWRLYAAHLFVDFPLQTPEILRRKEKFHGVFSHVCLVFICSLIILFPLFIYRPSLILMIFLSTILHLGIDTLKLFAKNPSARHGILIFLGDQVTHIGALILVAALFGFGRNYGLPRPFILLCLAISAIWASPIVTFVAKKAFANCDTVGIYVEPWRKFAILERALLFVGIGILNGIFIPLAITSAILIRILLYFNETNVPIPIFEWILTIIFAIIARWGV